MDNRLIISSALIFVTLFGACLFFYIWVGAEMPKGPLPVAMCKYGGGAASNPAYMLPCPTDTQSPNIVVITWGTPVPTDTPFPEG